MPLPVEGRTPREYIRFPSLLINQTSRYSDDGADPSTLIRRAVSPLIAHELRLTSPGLAG